MRRRTTILAAALSSGALVLSGAAYAQIAGGVAGSAGAATHTTMQGAKGMLNTNTGVSTQSGAGVSSASNATMNGQSGAGINAGTNAPINASTNAQMDGAAKADGVAGMSGSSDMNAKVTAHTSTNANASAGMQNAANSRPKAGANDITMQQAENLSGRTVTGANGRVLGTIKSVQKGSNGMEQVYLHTASATGLHGKVVALPAAMFSGQAAASSNGELKAPTVTKADLREMPTAQGSMNGKTSL